MSLLESLVRQHARLHAQGRAPEYGYGRVGISFALVLTHDGELVDVRDIRDSSGETPHPQRMAVPQQPVGRTSGVKPNLLWDKTSYALGVTRDGEAGGPVPAERGEHEAFRAEHARLLDGAEDAGLRALRMFLERWTPERFEELHQAPDLLDANVVFQLDGAREYLHERPEARRLWRRYLARLAGRQGVCLVTGESAPLARRHPRVQGVLGAQPSGGSLVSFNLDACKSFDREQGDNAPVSEAAAFAYTTALNTMLAPGSGHRLRIGDTTTVFWAEAEGSEAKATAAEELFAMLLWPPSERGETAVAGNTLAGLAEGRPWRTFGLMWTRPPDSTFWGLPRTRLGWRCVSGTRIRLVPWRDASASIGGICAWIRIRGGELLRSGVC